MSNNSIYNYKTPKSGNEETGFFNIKGRITRKAFFLRWLFGIGLYPAYFFLWCGFDFLNNLFYFDYEGYRSFIFFETIFLYVLPSFILVYNLIQGAKRMHDVNKSGWYFLFPFYNIYLTFTPGTKGSNDYGIDPSPTKNIQYFDEIESNKHDNKEGESITKNKSGLDKWKNYLLLLTIIIVAADIYYYDNNRHYFLNYVEYQDLEMPIVEEEQGTEEPEEDFDILEIECEKCGELLCECGAMEDESVVGTEEADEWKALIRTTDREKLKNIISKVQNINNNLEPDDGIYGIADASSVNNLVNADKLPISTSDLFEFTKVKSIQGGPYGIFMYDYFSCRFNEKGSKIFFQKTSGSQRKSGYMYRKDEYSFVFLGGSSVNDDPQTTYDSRNGEAGILYKVSNNKIIMLFFSDRNYEIFEIIK